MYGRDQGYQDYNRSLNRKEEGRIPREKIMKTLITMICFLCYALPAAGQWNFDRHSIPLDEIQSGGPPRDGIPALMQPKFIKAAEAGFLNDRDDVLGVTLGGIAKAYPVRILSWHELVNDDFGGEPVLVSW